MKMRHVRSESGAHRCQKASVQRALQKRGLTLKLVFHPEALAFDDDGVGMMGFQEQQALNVR